MEAVIEHLTEKWIAYAAILACVLPLIYVFRKYTLPFIAFVVEYAIYCSLLHTASHFFVRIVRWFSFETQMKMLADQRVDAGWETPLLQFWNREGYVPGWIFYAELVAIVAILALMFKYRPMKTQKIKQRRPTVTKGTSPEELRRQMAERMREKGKSQR